MFDCYSLLRTHKIALSLQQLTTISTPSRGVKYITSIYKEKNKTVGNPKRLEYIEKRRGNLNDLPWLLISNLGPRTLGKDLTAVWNWLLVQGLIGRQESYRSRCLRVLCLLALDIHQSVGSRKKWRDREYTEIQRNSWKSPSSSNSR